MNSTDKPYFDVVIVGAGPAGASCASLLARRGIRVLLCDKAKFPREKICGDCINPKSWTLFDLLGISHEVAANAEIVKGVKIIGDAGTVLDIQTSTRSEGHPLIAIKRSLLDGIIVRRAIDDGAVFYDETAFESADREEGNDGKWNLRLRKRGSKDSVNIKGRILIGADGRNSRVANLLTKENKESSKEETSDRIGVQFFVKRPKQIGSNIVMFFFDGGYGGVVGVSAEAANVAMVVTQKLAHLASHDFARFILSTIHSNGHMRETAPCLELAGEINTAFPITPRMNHFHSTGIYLIGDARRTAEPFTGEGVFFAMQDGIRVAEVILQSSGIRTESDTLQLKSRFWVDSIFSPILQNGTRVEPLLRFGVRHKRIAGLVAGRIFGN